MHPDSPGDKARFVRGRFPNEGLFEGKDFRIAPAPFELEPRLAKDLEFLGRVLFQFNRATNLLYRLSVAGKQPAWIARWLDQGKPAELIELQRSATFKNDLPRVIRPDVLLTETGLAITELDSVPGGIGLTGWLNQTYADLTPPPTSGAAKTGGIIGGADGMIRGFENIFGDAPRVHVVVSEEAATYRPEMEWICAQLGTDRFAVRDSQFTGFEPGDAVYRFFELFDLHNVANARQALALAREGKIQLTPPPKPLFEEKLLLALLWNRNLRDFWRQELGGRFLDKMLESVPYTWVMDPAPLPAHGAIPELNLTDWNQLKTLSQKERNLILKISGYSEQAWGARGVFLGNDLSSGDWSAAVDVALRSFEKSPHVLQRFHKPRTVETRWFDFEAETEVTMQGRVRLCPYFFVTGQGDSARTQLGGVLATICPADKKIIHGMRDAILVPCSTAG